MPNLLKQLELEELSLVDRPANAQATVSLYKRDNSDQEENMEKELEDLQNEVATLKSEAEAKDAENERLRKGLLDAGYVIKSDKIEKKAEPEYIEVEGEKVNKADVPAVILKALEAADAEKAEASLAKRAEEELPNFAPEVAKSILKSLDGSDELDAIMEALKAADAAFAETMEEFGKKDVDGDLGDAQAKMDKLVKNYQRENNVTEAQAYAAVAKTADGKMLINDIYKKDSE